MSLVERITKVLTPDLGENTADTVARHLCAKYGVGEDAPEPARVQELQDTIRRGLVAFVGPDRARTLAEECFKGLKGAS